MAQTLTLLMTLILQVDPNHPQRSAIEQAASVIVAGGLVAFPTETVYGLGADAMNEKAVRRVFEAKGRPADNPLIVHVANRGMLSLIASEVDSRAERLIELFWPGPLTLVLKRKVGVAPSVSAGLNTVAVRMPKNRIALELIATAATPVAAPSANLSGRPSPTCAAHVVNDLSGLIDVILDGGPTRIGIESTVLDMTTCPPAILRPGWITQETLAEIIGQVESPPSEEELRRSPGTRHRHYTPRAPVILIEPNPPEVVQQICSDLLRDGPVGFIGHSVKGISSPDFAAVYLEPGAAAYARSIYAGMRQLDEKNPRVIVVEGISDAGEGAAVMDRLRRAASQIIASARQGQNVTSEI